MVVFRQTLFLNWKQKKVSKFSVPIDSQNRWKLDVLDSWALIGPKMVDLYLDGINTWFLNDIQACGYYLTFCTFSH